MNKKGLRIFTLLFFLGLLVALASCSKKNTTTNTSSSSDIAESIPTEESIVPSDESTSTVPNTLEILFSDDLVFEDNKASLTVETEIDSYEFNISVNDCTNYKITDNERVEIENNTVSLQYGANIFYITLFDKDDFYHRDVYTVNIYRNKKFLVTFDSDGGTEINSIYVEEGKTINNKILPTKPGYDFVNWYYSGEVYDFSKPVTCDMILKAHYKASEQTNYVVIHYKENIDGTYDKHHSETETLKGITNDYTNAKAKKYDGFHSPAIKQEKINADGSTVINLYYTRMKYTLTTSISNSSYGYATKYDNMQFKYEEEVTLTVDLYPGYVFDGWFNDSTMLSNELEYKVKIGTEDLVLVAMVSKATNTRYVVNHYLETLDGEYQKSPNYVDNLSGETEALTKAEFMKLDGFTPKDSVKQEAIKGDGSTKINLYYTRNTYKLSVYINDVNGGSITSYDNYDCLYEKEIELTATTALGYSFDGWYNGTEIVSKDLVYKIKMPNNDLTYYAIFEAKTDTAYKVYHYYEKIDGSYPNEPDAVDDLTGKTGSKTAATAKDIDTQVPSTFNQLEIKGDGSTIVNIFYKLRTYSVSISINNENGGYVVTNLDNRYKCGESVTLEIGIYNNYRLVGWYSDDELVSDERKYTFTMPSGDVALKVIFKYMYMNIELNLDNYYYSGNNIVEVKYGYTEGKFPIITGMKNKVYSYQFKGWMYNDELITDSNGKLIKNWTFDEDITLVPSFDEKTLYFGSYPQKSVVANETNGLSFINFDKNLWKDYGYYRDSEVQSYMYYKDVDTDKDGVLDYRGVYFTEYRPYTTTGTAAWTNYTNNYSKYNIYWFEYNPIKWNVLESKDGKAFIISELLIDSQDYYYSVSSNTDTGSTVYPNNYMHSHIRSWLNDTFYNTAFNDLEKAIIETTNVDNSTTSTLDTENNHLCASTKDKLFLLSTVEALKYYPKATDRQANATDYALIQGLNVDNSNGQKDAAWWLRTPDYEYAYKAYMASISENFNPYYIRFIEVGVRPACWITL